eukprot:6054488-Prymnesium_polylepis.2
MTTSRSKRATYLRMCNLNCTRECERCGRSPNLVAAHEYRWTAVAKCVTLCADLALFLWTCANTAVLVTNGGHSFPNKTMDVRRTPSGTAKWCAPLLSQLSILC